MSSLPWPTDFEDFALPSGRLGVQNSAQTKKTHENNIVKYKIYFVIIKIKSIVK